MYYTNPQLGHCDRAERDQDIDWKVILFTDSYTSFTSTLTAISHPLSTLQQSRNESFPIHDPRCPQSSSWAICSATRKKEGTQGIKESWKYLCLAVANPPAQRHHKHGFPSVVVNPVRWDMKSNSNLSPLAFLLQYTNFKSCIAKGQGERSGEQGMLVHSSNLGRWFAASLSKTMHSNHLRTLIFTVPATDQKKYLSCEEK